jgi:hypothetical protein
VPAALAPAKIDQLTAAEFIQRDLSGERTNRSRPYSLHLRLIDPLTGHFFVLREMAWRADFARANTQAEKAQL